MRIAAPLRTSSCIPEPKVLPEQWAHQLGRNTKVEKAFVALHKHVEAGKTTTVPTVSERPQLTPSLPTSPKFSLSMTPRNGAHGAGALGKLALTV